MDVDELVERVRSVRARWDALLGSVPLEVWETPGVAGEWTLRDVVAHITWFEREILAQNTHEHYEADEAGLRRWLALRVEGEAS